MTGNSHYFEFISNSRYDYNLNLKKIINMPFRMLRLCGDVESNTVYAMAINPEFELISIDLE